MEELAGWVNVWTREVGITWSSSLLKTYSLLHLFCAISILKSHHLASLPWYERCVLDCSIPFCRDRVLNLLTVAVLLTWFCFWSRNARFVRNLFTTTTFFFLNLKYCVQQGFRNAFKNCLQTFSFDEKFYTWTIIFGCWLLYKRAIM